ncbi:hypothetical protein Tco_0156157 [Tanacetum coccineum]
MSGNTTTNHLARWKRVLIEESFAPFARLETEKVYVAQNPKGRYPDHPNNLPSKESFVWIKNASSKSRNDKQSKLPDVQRLYLKTLIMPDALIWKNTSGGIPFLVITCTADVKEKNCTVISSTEAEYVALSASCVSNHKVVRLGINPMIQPEPEDLPKDNPKLEIAVLRYDWR